MAFPELSPESTQLHGIPAGSTPRRRRYHRDRARRQTTLGCPPWIKAWREDLTFTFSGIATHSTYHAVEDNVSLGVYCIVLDDPNGELDARGVHPNAMGQGIGRALFPRAETTADARSVASRRTGGARRRPHLPPGARAAPAPLPLGVGATLAAARTCLPAHGRRPLHCLPV